MQVTDMPAGRRGPRGRDWGLMMLLLAPSLAQVLLDPIATRPIGVLVALGTVVPLAWRRSHPTVAAVIGTALWLVPTEGYLILGFVVAAILFYSVGAHEPRDARAAAVAVWGSAVGTYSILRSEQAPESAFVLLVVVVAPVLVGRVVREWERRAHELADLAARLQGERRQAEQLAIAQERNRIARELHDVVGHDVTVIALQAEAASAALARDPARAAEPVEAIRRTAAHTMHEMRRVVGGLRGADDDTTAPAPGADDIATLVAQSRSLGQEVDLTMRGDTHPQDATVGLAVYRIVQESLTNARRHAPGARVTLDIDWGTDAVSMQASQPLSDGENSGGGENGMGILGMRERVRLLGGTFSAGPGEDGRFVVSARVPYDEASVR